MAGSLQDVTTYGDEAVLEMQALLLSFSYIRGDTFRDATEGALDLATGIGVDLRSAAIQLGKAPNDPARDLDALSRSGTTFTDAEREQIKAMAETADLRAWVSQATPASRLPTVARASSSEGRGRTAKPRGRTRREGTVLIIRFRRGEPATGRQQVRRSSPQGSPQFRRRPCRP